MVLVKWSDVNMKLQEGSPSDIAIPYCRRNQIEGQMNLRDAVRRDISYKDPKSGKTYQLKSKV